MTINVEYDETKQTEALCGPFVFTKDCGVIHNLEARW